jgi:hypothetical protein
MANVSKILINGIFVYIPLIYKYDTYLAKYLSDLYISFYKCRSSLYIETGYINMDQILNGFI